MTIAELLADSSFERHQSITPDPQHAAWLPVARNLLEPGAMASLDRSTRESIAIGLRSNPDPLARQALAQLKS